MRVQANGIGINYQIDGTERAPWLIFSNSLATDLTMWDAQARELAGAFRVLRYDQRGHGKTEAPAGRYTFDMLIADVLALMDALGIKRANFCGLSMGGATALGLAQRHPDRIDTRHRVRFGCASTAQSAQQWEERIAVAQKDGHGAAGRADGHALVSAGRGREKSAISRQGARDGPRDAGEWIHRMRGGAGRSRFPFCGREHKRAGPVHRGREGRRRGGRDRDEGSSRRCPARAMSSLPGAGHISNLDDPSGFTKALSGFLA